MGENSFLESFAQILFIRDVYGGGNSPIPQNGALPQHPERLQGGNVRAEWVIPHQITLMSPLISYMAGMDQVQNDCHVWTNG